MSAIQSIGPEQAQHVAARNEAIPGFTAHRTSAASGTVNGGREYEVRLSNEAVDIAHLQDAKNDLHETAKGVRTSDQSLKQAIEYIDRMKADLKAITKQYPPFPPGSEERVNFLKSFSAFRRQIEKLTIPSPVFAKGVAAGGDMSEIRQA